MSVSLGSPVTRSAVLAGAVGNVMEWYDFGLYGYFATVIGRQFFPSSDPVASLLAAFAVFASGFLVRPLGGVIFGHYGDRLGRRTVLAASVMLMAIPTFAIGLLPTYAQVGVLAPLLLVVARLLQGLSSGGEYSARSPTCWSTRRLPAAAWSAARRPPRRSWGSCWGRAPAR